MQLTPMRRVHAKTIKELEGTGKKGERGEKRLGMSQNWTLTKLVTDCLNSELLS